MIFMVALVCFLLAATVLSRAFDSAKRGAYKRLCINVAVAILLLIGGGIAMSYAIRDPGALSPSPDSTCPWGADASACK